MKRTICALSLLFLSGGAAAEIYRCSGTGKTLLSDQPCPSEMSAETLKSPSENTARPSSSGKSDEKAYLERITQERRMREIDFEIGEKGNAIKDNIDRMNQEIAELQKQADKVSANPLNALAQQSLHIKMQAIAAKYRVENSALSDQISQLRLEKRALGVP
jgi:hypothetical protein